MDLKLKGKTALITGGSEGIGKGIALALAKEGVDIAMCARRKEPLEAAAGEIAKTTGRKVVAIPADLRQDKDAKNFVEQGHRALGRVDIPVKPLPALLDDAVATFPDRPCIDFLGKKYSYRDIGALVDRAAKGFGDLGVAKGDDDED